MNQEYHYIGIVRDRLLTIATGETDRACDDWEKRRATRRDKIRAFVEASNSLDKIQQEMQSLHDENARLKQMKEG